jgi:hypothetical protein
MVTLRWGFVCPVEVPYILYTLDTSPPCVTDLGVIHVSLHARYSVCTLGNVAVPACQLCVAECVSTAPAERHHVI